MGNLFSVYIKNYIFIFIYFKQYDVFYNFYTKNVFTNMKKNSYNNNNNKTLAIH